MSLENPARIHQSEGWNEVSNTVRRAQELPVVVGVGVSPRSPDMWQEGKLFLSKLTTKRKPEPCGKMC